MNKAVFRVILLTVICGISVFAQKNNNEKPNFDGTWLLVESKSNDTKGDSRQKIARRLVIEQSGLEFKVTENQIVELLDGNANPSLISVFYTDKRGEKNINGQTRTIETKTWEKGGKIVISETLGNPQLETYLVTAFSLSKNGDELTVKTFPFADPSNTLNKDVYKTLPAESKRVYRRVVK